MSLATTFSAAHSARSNVPPNRHFCQRFRSLINNGLESFNHSFNFKHTLLTPITEYPHPDVFILLLVVSVNNRWTMTSTVSVVTKLNKGKPQSATKTPNKSLSFKLSGKFFTLTSLDLPKETYYVL